MQKNKSPLKLKKMKKIFYLLLLMVSFNSFGQKTDWGAWAPASSCYTGLEFSLRISGNTIYSKGEVNWEVRFRNNYGITMIFSYDVYNTDVKSGFKGNFRTRVRPGEQKSRDLWFLRTDRRNLQIYIEDVRFGETDYSDMCKNIFLYADCDKRPKVANWPPDCNQKNGKTTENNSSNSNQSTSNSNGNNTQSGNDNNSNSVDKTNNQIDRMNQYMEKIPDSDPEKTNINNEVNRITSNTNLTDSQRASQLNPLIDRAQRRASAIDSERNAKIEEGKRIQKENSAKIKKFDDTMKQGETALNNGKYDEAIGHFSQAYNIAPIEEARQMALQAIETAKKAKEDAARRVRIAEKQQQEQVTNDATTASLTAAIGLMVAMTDKISDGNFAAKFRFGVGMEQIPLVANVAKWKQVETATLLPTTFTFAFKTIFNNRGAFSIYAQPEIVLGLNAFQKGTSGGYISYGGMAGFQLGTSYKSKIKLFGEAGYFSRTGSYSYDLDVASGGTSATDRITEGEFKYNLLRFGGGIMFHFLNEDDDKEVIIKPAYYLEKLSFAPDSKPTGVFGFSISGLRLGQFDFMYSKNYAIGGKADYPAYWIIAAAPAYDKNYYQIRYTRQIRLK